MQISRRNLIKGIGAATIVTSISHRADARLLRGTASSPPVSNLTFNLVWDAAALAAPASFRTAITNAAALISAACPHTSATLNFNVSYNVGGSTGTSVPTTFPTFYSYATLKSILAANQFSASMTTMVTNLPASDPGFGPYQIATSTAKGLGQLSGTASASDGSITFGSLIPAGNLVGAALSELTHAMGRTTFAQPLGFCRFSSAHVFESSWAQVPAYFSLDNGVTKLADFDATNGDSGNWKVGGVQDVALGNPPIDACDALYNSGSLQTLSAVDVTALNIMGIY